MSDTEEITALLNRYARAVDTKDWELYRTVFTDDAVIDYSSTGIPVGSLDEIVEMFGKTFGAVPWTMHYITNVEAKIFSGGREGTDSGDGRATPRGCGRCSTTRCSCRECPSRVPAAVTTFTIWCAPPTAGAAVICARTTCGSSTAPTPTPRSKDQMQIWTGTAFMHTTETVLVARMLDEAGFDGIVVSDHMIYPRELSSPYPSPTGKPMWTPETAWPDSWVLIGAMAAVTQRIRFTNAVYIAPARPLLEVAKQVATAAVISGGRVALTVGAGWMREEFELMGQDFANRGKRLDEMIEALPALWRGGWVSWNGKHYQVTELMLEPHPQKPVPIMCGGESEAALRRAARLCDGWVGNAYTWEEADEKVNCSTHFVAATDASTSLSRSCSPSARCPRSSCSTAPRISA